MHQRGTDLFFISETAFNGTTRPLGTHRQPLHFLSFLCVSAVLRRSAIALALLLFSPDSEGIILSLHHRIGHDSAQADHVDSGKEGQFLKGFQVGI